MRRFLLHEIIRQMIDFRGRTPLKLGMDWGGTIRALSASNVQMGRINFDKESNFGSDQLYQRWMTKGDCQRGDILFTTEAPLGHVAQIPDGDRYILSQRVILFKTEKENAEPNYLFQLFQSNSFQAALAKQSSGSTVTGIQQARLAKIQIELPTLPQQRRIAEILTTLDEEIEATESLIVKYQQIKAGLMHDLFTRGLWTQAELDRGDHHGTPFEASAKKGHLRPTPEQAPQLYQDSPLGKIPKTSRTGKIGSLFDIQLGKMLNKLAKSGKYSALYLGNRSVQWDRIDPTAIEEMDFSPAEREKFRLKYGDLLVCEGGDVGRTAMWRDDIENCFYQKAIHRLRPKADEVLPAFMLRYMRYAKDSGHFAEFTSQSSIAHLTQEKLASIPMLIPPVPEQDQMVSRCDGIDGQLDTETTHLAKLRQQKQGLMHDLLTGRVRVKSESQD